MTIVKYGVRRKIDKQLYSIDRVFNDLDPLLYDSEYTARKGKIAIYLAHSYDMLKHQDELEIVQLTMIVKDCVVIK